MTNKSKTLYVGVTNNLQRRVYEHKNKMIQGFTSKYNITKVVYYEVFNDIESAIRREKQIKGWLRKKKIDLIESMNPDWNDLSEEWGIWDSFVVSLPQNDVDAIVILNEVRDLKLRFFIPLRFIQNDKLESVRHSERREESP